VPSGSWGETTVNHLHFPAGMSIFLNEAQNLGIEPERFVLVVDENASKTDKALGIKARAIFGSPNSRFFGGTEQLARAAPFSPSLPGARVEVSVFV
jgi:hypothetical protein